MFLFGVFFLVLSFFCFFVFIFFGGFVGFDGLCFCLVCFFWF